MQLVLSGLASSARVVALPLARLADTTSEGQHHACGEQRCMLSLVNDGKRVRCSGCGRFIALMDAWLDEQTRGKVLCIRCRRQR